MVRKRWTEPRDRVRRRRALRYASRASFETGIRRCSTSCTSSSMSEISERPKAHRTTRARGRRPLVRHVENLEHEKRDRRVVTVSVDDENTRSTTSRPARRRCHSREIIVSTVNGPFADHLSGFGTNGTQAHFSGLDRRFWAPFDQDRIFRAAEGISLFSAVSISDADDLIRAECRAHPRIQVSEPPGGRASCREPARPAPCPPRQGGRSRRSARGRVPVDRGMVCWGR